MKRDQRTADALDHAVRTALTTALDPVLDDDMRIEVIRVASSLSVDARATRLGAQPQRVLESVNFTSANGSRMLGYLLAKPLRQAIDEAIAILKKKVSEHGDDY